MVSTYDGAEPPAGYRGSVGASLREAREQLGWSIADLAAHLRIRGAYLEAMEAGRAIDLPGMAYTIGFLRTYAQALGLDPDEIARRYRAETGDGGKRPQLSFPAPVPDRGVPAGAVVLIGAIIAVGAYVGWYRWSANERPRTEQVQPVPDRLAPLADRLNPPVQSPAASALVGSAGSGDPLAAPGPAPALPRAAELPASQPSVPPSALPGAGGYAGGAAASLTTTPPPVASPAQQAAAPPPAPAAIDGPRIVVRARTDSWVQVRERQGQVLLNRVMRAGETWPVPAKANLLLTTGNAGGTEVVVDGTPIASLGNDGAVRRDMLLDPDALKLPRSPSAPPPRRGG